MIAGRDDAREMIADERCDERRGDGSGGVHAHDGWRREAGALADGPPRLQTDFWCGCCSIHAANWSPDSGES
jgi:hypothetical protein